MATDRSEFGRFFRSRRTALGLNLSEFCRQNGFDKGNVSRLERGLKKPPESPDLLRAYAEALQLPADSEDWKKFMGHAAIARKTPVGVSDERPPPSKRCFDGWAGGSTIHGSRHGILSNGRRLATLRRAFPHLSANSFTPTNSPDPTTTARIEMPGEEGVQRHGWDGVVDVRTKSLFLFLPASAVGKSAWNSGRQTRRSETSRPERRGRWASTVRSDFRLRHLAEVGWQAEVARREEGIAAYGRVLKSTTQAISKHGSKLRPALTPGLPSGSDARPPGVVSIGDYWESLSRLCEPRLKPDVFLASRKKTAKELSAFLLGTPGVMPIECRSPMEALDFVAAYLETIRSDDTEFAMDDDDRLRVRSRTVIVKDRGAVGRTFSGGGSVESASHPFAVPDSRGVECRRQPRPPNRDRGHAVFQSSTSTDLASAAVAI